MGRIFKWIVVTGLLSGMAWMGWKWLSVEKISGDAFSLIPSDVIYCIATNDPIGSWKQVSGSETWAHLNRNAYFAELTASANSLDSLIRENDLLFDLIGSRALMISAHMTAPGKYDFLFLADLQKAAGIKFINEYLTGFSAGKLTIRSEKYKNDDLLVIYDPSDQSSLYISVPGNYLLVSYSKKIISSALDAWTNQDSLTRTRLVRAEDDLTNDGLFRLYVSYEQLPRFMTAYSTGSNEYVSRLASALKTTSLSIGLGNELIKATGHTYVNDSVESYIKTLAVSGKGATEFLEIAPQRTAFSLALGFTSFGEFFENFQQNIQHDVAEYDAYRENLTQVENYLKINVQENLISWIGDEVALLELQSFGKGLDNETAIVLKASNIESARRNLEHIEKMIRRKTPVKFKAIDHRGYSINYLSMKGLFKVLLGKFFARYDKPYYTIINNFVVFSNHPQTLQSMVDDYLDRSTLIRSDEFRTFRKEFEDEGSVFIYFNTPILFNSMKKLAGAPTRMSMEKNKQFITCFRHVGFQLTPEQGRFKTIFAEQFVAPEPAPQFATVPEPKEESAPLKAIVPEESAEPSTDENEFSENADPMELPYIYVKNLNASSFSDYYPDSTIHFSVELKNGFKDGSFTEYHRNGEVKMTGRFKNNKRDGIWRLYDENGKLILRRSYEEGEIKREKSRE